MECMGGLNDFAESPNVCASWTWNQTDSYGFWGSLKLKG